MVRRPANIIAAITPFNFPLNLSLHKIGPALAGGNAVDAAIKKIERAQANPTLDLMAKIAEVLDTDVEVSEVDDAHG